MLDAKVNSCRFCAGNEEKFESRIIAKDEFSFFLHDAYPVSKGHILIIPHRHISSIFQATQEEKLCVLNSLQAAKDYLCENLSPQGFNVGINDGDAAGRTIPHLHIHLIPRYDGDIVDPRGGVRWVLPKKAPYWASNL
jgi:diadenosine tetraphosphate (Ap4A) HIT family hydrolase